MKKVLLCDNWRLFGEKADGLPATVPGCVHTDLLNNGMIDDLYWRDNNKAYQWIEKEKWNYCCSFDAELSEHVYLVFDGLDTYADIYLNGEHIAVAENMFLPLKINVSGKIKEKDNFLEVRFRSPVKEVEGNPELEAAFTAERLYTRRIQCTYGWDWVDRFVTCGIFRPVYLDYTSGMYAKNVYVSTENIDAFGAQIYTEIEFENQEQGGIVHTEIIAPGGAVVASANYYSEEALSVRRFDIEDPKLWYPNGCGKQPLYTIRVTVGENTVSDTFGIRTIKILQSHDNEDSEFHKKAMLLQQTEIGKLYSHNKTTCGFQVIVNGIPILCKGANWVPCEPFPSAETDEKYQLLVSEAKQMNMNMLRVWGGGLFERRAFYDTCDRNGILVAQDFMMACGHYPEKQEWFINALRAESEYAVKLLRNHPCIAWWHGDNENAQYGRDLATDYTGRDTAFKGIAPQIHRFDRGRCFLPSSPYGGDMYASLTSGTSHISNYCNEMFAYFHSNDCRDYKQFFEQFSARFISEEPTFGAASLASMLRFMTPEDLFGDEREYILRYHTKNNPAFEREIYDDVKEFTQKLLGAFTDGQDRFFKYKYVQYEWIRVVFELCRRDLGYCNGMLFWMLNDCWPAALGWSLIDYYGVPKAAYYSFKRCAQRVVSSITEKEGCYTVTVSKDATGLERINGRAYLLDRQNGYACVDEYIFHMDIETYGTLDVTLPWGSEKRYMVVCDISYAGGTDRSFYVDGVPELCPANHFVNVVAHDQNDITVRADHYVHVVEVEGSYCCLDNYFSLMPGEVRRIAFERRITDASLDLQVTAYTLK